MSSAAQKGHPNIKGAARLTVWSTVAALMLVPVLAIRGFDAAAWDPPGDFVFLAILFTGVVVAYEMAARVQHRHAYVAALGIALAAAAIGGWINLAVGIVGSEDNLANWIFAGPPAVALIGGALARFRPWGMAQAVLAAATVQVGAFAIAVIAGLGFTGPITVFFTALWLISAWQFRRAAQEQM